MSVLAQREELTTLLQHTLSLDVIGDTTAAVGEPADLVAWATMLIRPIVLAWRCAATGSRTVQVQARHVTPPINGHIMIQLSCECYPEFWSALVGEELSPGEEREFDRRELLTTWITMEQVATIPY